VEDKTQFTQEAFWDFTALIEAKHDYILMKWVTNELDLNMEGMEFLSFEPRAGHSMQAMYRDPITKDKIPITQDIFAALVDRMKSQAAGKSSCPSWLPNSIMLLIAFFMHL
jgi:hypothetical protein